MRCWFPHRFSQCLYTPLLSVRPTSAEPPPGTKKGDLSFNRGTPGNIWILNSTVYCVHYHHVAAGPEALLLAPIFCFDSAKSSCCMRSSSSCDSPESFILFFLRGGAFAAGWARSSTCAAKCLNSRSFRAFTTCASVMVFFPPSLLAALAWSVSI